MQAQSSIVLVKEVQCRLLWWLARSAGSHSSVIPLLECRSVLTSTPHSVNVPLRTNTYREESPARINSTWQDFSSVRKSLLSSWRSKKRYLSLQKNKTLTWYLKLQNAQSKAEISQCQYKWKVNCKWACLTEKWSAPVLHHLSQPISGLTRWWSKFSATWRRLSVIPQQWSAEGDPEAKEAITNLREQRLLSQLPKRSWASQSK